MADRKRQHYVPKFYLRNFSSDHARKTINIFNITRERTIARAGLKEQCYKDYFYGRELELEERLGILETTTSVILQKIIDSSTVPETPGTIMHLCLFVILQYLRTLAAEADTNDMLDRLLKTIYRFQIGQEALDKIRISLTNASAFNALTGVLVSPVCFDLKPALLLNLTNKEFVTCDNSVTLANQFWPGRFPGDGSHLAASGLMILLPLSPKHTLLLYDQGVYSVPKDQGNRVEVNKLEDVAKLNELQMLRAFENIYFSRLDQAPALEVQFQKCKVRRRESYVNIHELVPGPNPGSYVRPDSDGELPTEGRTLVLTERVGLDVTLRFNFLKVRHKPRYHYDGSAAGALRDPAWSRIASEFSRAVQEGAWDAGDMERFVKLHPLWRDTGRWTKRFFGE